MKTQAILKSTVNLKQARDIISKVTTSKSRLAKIKLREERAMIRDLFASAGQPVYYFDEPNILGLPRWM